MPATRSSLTADRRQLGLARGSVIMVHAGVRSVGLVTGGVNVIVQALQDAIESTGTIVAYVDFEPFCEDGDGEFDTATPVNELLPADGFERIARAYLASGRSAVGSFGTATATRLDGSDLVDFGIDWLERYFDHGPPGGPSLLVTRDPSVPWQGSWSSGDSTGPPRG